MKNICVLVFTFFFSITTFKSIACGPCANLSGITQTLSGNNLALTFTSNAGWPCCYNVTIEIVCANINFTGVGNYSSAQLCLSPSAMTNVPYPITNIDISNFCSGTYKWRAYECNGIWTPEYQFTISNPSQLTISASDLLLCVGESSNLNANASLCGGGPYNYSWSPAVGLSNANISNPIATPNSTTTYTVTATGADVCAETSEQITVTVNPLPVAAITNTVSVCQDDPSPNVTLSGAGGTAPYTINYNLNGILQTPVVTTGNNFIIQAPTDVTGPYTYSIVDITESSSLACSQNQNSTITVTVLSLPVAAITNTVSVCQDDPSPNVTLSGAGGTAPYTINYNLNGILQTPVVTTGNNFIIQAPTDVTGPYTYSIVDITESSSLACSQNQNSTITVTVLSLPVAAITNTVSVCQDDPSPNVTLSGAGGTAPYTINYNLNGILQTPVVTTGNNFIIQAPTDVPGPYTYSIVDITESSSLACSQNQNSTITVTVHPNPIANFTDICGSLLAKLTNTSIGAINYYWDMGDGSPIITSKDISYIYTIMDSIFYNIILIAETEFGCLDSASKIFTPPLLFYSPNTFTPDGDEFNNTFIPVFSNKNKVESIHLLIYNRWGEIVFESENIDFGWDGTYKNRIAQDGTYTWELIFTNNSCLGKKEHLYGAVNLIR
jgi:gliding motility-associated-like protein